MNMSQNPETANTQSIIPDHVQVEGAMASLKPEVMPDAQTEMIADLALALGYEDATPESWPAYLKLVTDRGEVLKNVSSMLGDPDNLYVAIQNLQAGGSADEIHALQQRVNDYEAERQDLLRAVEGEARAKQEAQAGVVRLGLRLQDARRALDALLSTTLNIEVDPEPTIIEPNGRSMEGFLIEPSAEQDQELRLAPPLPPVPHLIEPCKHCGTTSHEHALNCPDR
jgi:hypothetical protein